MKVLSSLQDSDSLKDSYEAQESCQERVSFYLLVICDRVGNSGLLW